MLDANDFFTFDKYRPPQKWSNLKSVILTSQGLAPDERGSKIMSMLQSAARATINAPQLQSLLI